MGTVIFHSVVWHKISGSSPVCFGTRDETYGPFTIGKAGILGALKLVHVHGHLVCHQASQNSFWGCEVPLYYDKTLMTIITYANHRTLLLPRRNSTEMGGYSICASGLTYKLHGFNDTSKEIIFNTTSAPLAVSSQEEFWIWYGQDLADCSEMNNRGHSCVHVYGWYI